ncbi:hypothetical protein DM860_013649 [Cuscuta australis]|uniref:RING-type domain-containing protein n=1 Tax=Cuscuta australis TaxID=267555 RepID=A0A328EEF4_9ASTE|nr:hypothetical protein DM860_013649 [Cuscuta australis]
MSKDFLNVYAHANNRKRKMKEVAADHLPPPPPRFASAPPAAPLSLFPLESAAGAGASSSAARHPPHLVSHFDTALRLSSVETGRQQAGVGGGDLGALSRPIQSFTSLLLTGDGSNEAAAEEECTHRVIKHAVTCYSKRVREMMEEMCMQQHAMEHAMAEERAAKKMKEKHDEMMGPVMARNSELERLLSNYRNQAMNMGHRIKTLEQTNASLRAVLHQATASLRSGGGGGEEVMLLVRQHHQAQVVEDQEDAQSSSSVDPEQSGRPVRLTCRLCARRIATVMLWPCRHLCLCKRCEGFANRCPVCEAAFQANIEVDLSG